MGMVWRLSKCRQGNEKALQSAPVLAQPTHNVTFHHSTETAVVQVSTAMPMTHSYISAKPDDKLQLNKIEDCIKDIKDWMSSNFHLLNSD